MGDTDDKAILDSKQKGENARKNLLDAEKRCTEEHEKLKLATEEARKCSQFCKQAKVNHKRGPGPYEKGPQGNGGGGHHG